MSGRGRGQRGSFELPLGRGHGRGGGGDRGASRGSRGGGDSDRGRGRGSGYGRGGGETSAVEVFRSVSAVRTRSNSLIANLVLLEPKMVAYLRLTQEQPRSRISFKKSQGLANKRERSFLIDLDMVRKDRRSCSGPTTSSFYHLRAWSSIATASIHSLLPPDGSWPR